MNLTLKLTLCGPTKKKNTNRRSIMPAHHTTHGIPREDARELRGNVLVTRPILNLRLSRCARVVIIHWVCCTPEYRYTLTHIKTSRSTCYLSRHMCLSFSLTCLYVFSVSLSKLRDWCLPDRFRHSHVYIPQQFRRLERRGAPTQSHSSGIWICFNHIIFSKRIKTLATARP